MAFDPAKATGSESFSEIRRLLQRSCRLADEAIEIGGDSAEARERSAELWAQCDDVDLVLIDRLSLAEERGFLAACESYLKNCAEPK